MKGSDIKKREEALSRLSRMYAIRIQTSKPEYNGEYYDYGIIPKLDTFNSFMEAVFEEFPRTKNHTFELYYKDSNDRRATISNESDFEIFQKLNIRCVSLVDPKTGHGEKFAPYKLKKFPCTITYEVDPIVESNSSVANPFSAKRKSKEATVVVHSKKEYDAFLNMLSKRHLKLYERKRLKELSDSVEIVKASTPQATELSPPTTQSSDANASAAESDYRDLPRLFSSHAIDAQTENATESEKST